MGAKELRLSGFVLARARAFWGCPITSAASRAVSILVHHQHHGRHAARRWGRGAVPTSTAQLSSSLPPPRLCLECGGGGEGDLILPLTPSCTHPGDSSLSDQAKVTPGVSASQGLLQAPGPNRCRCRKFLCLVRTERVLGWACPPHAAASCRCLLQCRLLLANAAARRLCVPSGALHPCGLHLHLAAEPAAPSPRGLREETGRKPEAGPAPS